jgi:hypothetical protein
MTKNKTNDQKPTSLKGLTTISPPAKVKIDASPAQILASGFDSLNLAIDVYWSSTDLFDYLHLHKEAAKKNRQDIPAHFELIPCKTKWHFTVKPHGSNGYEWLISNKEFTFKIGSWLEPQSKPSVLAEIRSETLWRLGAKNAVELIVNILLSVGGTKITLKPSRADLCVDVLMDENLWTPDLVEYSVTRSIYSALHFNQKKVTGLSIGKGKISARLYDKPLEIQQQSKKFWMYDIWGIEEVPEERKVIRVEFQLRREILTELAVNGVEDLFEFQSNLWAYCGKKWLKFQTNPGKHHTQRKVLDWWKVVQKGYAGAQGRNPLIRSKAAQFDIDQNCAQAIGHLKGLTASLIHAQVWDKYIPAEIENGLQFVLNKINQSEDSRAKYSDSVKEKIAKTFRSISRHLDAETERKKLNLPSAI